MPTAPYFVKGKRVPGVTTVLGGCQECGALIYWAGNVTQEAAVRYIEEVPPVNHTVEGLNEYILKYGPRAVSKEACDIGTIAHEMVECRLTGTKFHKDKYPREYVRQALNAYRAFKDWTAGLKESVVYSTEHSLTSELFYYGGTIDLVKDDNGQLVIQDWKTSKALRDSYWHQVAAYRQLVVENFPDADVANHADVVRFDKATGDFDHKRITCLTDHFHSFLHKRAVYELKKKPNNQIRECIDNIHKHFASIGATA